MSSIIKASPGWRPGQFQASRLLVKFEPVCDYGLGGRATKPSDQEKPYQSNAVQQLEDPKFRGQKHVHVAMVNGRPHWLRTGGFRYVNCASSSSPVQAVVGLHGH